MDEATHLGEVVSINNSIMLLVADGERVTGWHGTSNGPVEFEPEGSDWEKALTALHPSTDAEREATKTGAFDGTDGRLFAPVRGADAEVTALSLSESGPGRVDVFAVGDRIVLVEGYYENRDDDAFRALVASAPDAGKKVGTIAIPSGKIACLPAPSRGAAFGEAAIDDSQRAAEVELDDESGLLVAGTAGAYDVIHETMAKGAWGEATRVVLVPTSAG